jgi:hypothetical protein
MDNQNHSTPPDEIMEVDPEVGQIYESNRKDEFYQILYLDEQIVMYRCDWKGRTGTNVHRIEKRTEFEDLIASGFFIHRPDSDLNLTSFEKEDWSEVDYIGEKTEQAMYDEGIETVLDVRKTDEAALLMIDGLGAKGLENLQEFCR